MDTTTIIIIICILAIVGIALLAIGIVRTCLCSEFDTVSYLLIEAGTIFLIFAIAITVMHFLWVKPEREAYETHVIEKVVESAQNKDMVIYIDGEPVSDEFDIKGIDLDKYNIKIEDDILYLISK